MSSSARPDVILLTPVAYRDLARAQLLLDSLHATGTKLAHFLVVDDEDIATAERELDHRDTQLVPTSAVLPPAVSQRRATDVRRRHLRYWTRGHWRHEPRLPGWTVQQLIKLHFSAGSDARAVVCLDSDLVVCRALTASDFVGTEGEALLFERADTEAEMLEWEIRAMRFLDVPLQGNAALRHTFEPAVLDPVHVRGLFELLEASSPRRWEDLFLPSNLTEYALYATYCRYRVPDSPEVRDPDLVADIRWPSQVDGWQHAATATLDAGAKLLHVRSHLGIAPAEIEAFVRPRWSQGSSA